MLNITPVRRRGVELMDDPNAEPELMVRSLQDVVRANKLFGGSRAVVAELMEAVDTSTAQSTFQLLDVGSGLGDIPATAQRAAKIRGAQMNSVVVDMSESSLQARVCPESSAVRSNALYLPFKSSSFDFVICSQLLHHFDTAEAVTLLRELDRVARLRVIVSDIRRSWFAAAGIWAASFPLRFHPVSRHDGVVSVLRGFTSAELRDLVKSATGLTAEVSTRAGFRVTASWIPSTGQP